MCGIAGVASVGGRSAIDYSRLGAMTDSLFHRGPDEPGSEICDGVALGMRRLSIIDLEGGSQPLYNEDRTIRVVFNGEIYNYRELRRSLEARGHRLLSQTDGEVIPHLWEELGPRFPSVLNGMFAIAVHDLRARRVTLVRDHFGIKPLYYSLVDGRLVFGSEVKALLASGMVPRELDIDALGEFMSWEYVPAPRTLLRGVRKLLPGGMLELDLASGTVQESAWWEPPAPNGRAGLPASEREWEEAVDAKISEAVQRQLISDVPLGAFLSGGVDSSLVVAAMGGAQTYSIGFEDPTYDETGCSRQVAAHLGVNHTIEVIRPDAMALFSNLMRYMDDPIADFSIFPTYLVSQVARREVKVALSGDGGDEVFGGYETYAAQSAARLWNRVPSLMRDPAARLITARVRPTASKKGLVNTALRFLEGAGHDPRLGHARWRLFVGERLRQELFTPEALAAMPTTVGDHVLRLADEAGQRGEVDRALYVDLRSYLADNCLVKVDRMAMACSLEVRVPLLDPELVVLAFRLPERFKVAGRQTKVLLKQLAARQVPAECVYRRKQGFSVPMKHWLNQEFRALLNELLAPDRLRREGIFRVDTVERLKREHARQEQNHSHVLWALMVFQDWRVRWAV
ncbi:MAG TPA: asparagine synthase (glutamine-hydrolyzing) [Gemmatimonadales bacterium]|jgi:asparagine synthase (glutamine-hydrolysing)|nr:asparagine synthase (glutamine-hydrolyzing) [Gemmatimonadales bacterium]